MTESAADAVSGRPVPGRVIVAERALRHTFSALAAEELGVPAKDVTIHVADSRGRLLVTVESPIALSPLGRTTGTSPARTALGIADAARTRIHRDGASLTGAALAEVRIRLKSTRLTESRRVS